MGGDPLSRFDVKATSWRLALPYSKPPLSLNDQPTASMGARMGRAALIKSVRRDGEMLARSAGIPPLARFSATLHWRPARNARRDALNLTATLKPLVDGLVDAGVCSDDDTTRYVGTEPMIHPAERGQPGRMWLVIEDQTSKVIEPTQGEQND
jgi:crossover junction endodeoxyribonuclease RusA